MNLKDDFDFDYHIADAFFRNNILNNDHLLKHNLGLLNLLKFLMQNYVYAYIMRKNEKDSHVEFGLLIYLIDEKNKSNIPLLDNVVIHFDFLLLSEIYKNSILESSGMCIFTNIEKIISNEQGDKISLDLDLNERKEIIEFLLKKHPKFLYHINELMEL
jgi:hypothetical protein